MIHLSDSGKEQPKQQPKEPPKKPNPPMPDRPKPRFIPETKEPPPGKQRVNS